MTPRERWLALLEDKIPDRVPTDYRATSEVTARLIRDLGCRDEDALWRRLHIDRLKSVGPTWNPISPRGETTDSEEAGKADIWGVRYRMIDYGTGSYEEADHHPLAHVDDAKQVHAYDWPDPDEFDCGSVTTALSEDDGSYPIQAGHYEPFLLYGYMRGLEQSFEDLVLHVGIADAILGHIFDIYHEVCRRIFEAGRGKIDITFVAEDLGSQTGPLISLDMYRRFLRPHQKQMADLARSYGIHVFYHTDGAARPFLPDLIDEVGIEILDPIQWRCPGMARESLVRDFGDRIAFHGSIDNQHTLPFGTVNEVIAEVRESLAIYRGARWICGPCHNIQPVTPTENIVAMYDTMHEEGETAPA